MDNTPISQFALRVPAQPATCQSETLFIFTIYFENCVNKKQDGKQRAHNIFLGL